MKIQDIKILVYLVPMPKFKPFTYNEENDRVEIFNDQMVLIGIGSETPLLAFTGAHIGPKLKEAIDGAPKLGIKETLPKKKSKENKEAKDWPNLSWEEFKDKLK